jgi:hypothetical protein
MLYNDRLTNNSGAVFLRLAKWLILLKGWDIIKIRFNIILIIGQNEI